MNAVRFISGKIRFKGYLTLICVAVSYLVMIVAVSVSSGFRNEIRNSLGENYGDVRLTPLEEDMTAGTVSLPRHPAFMDRLEQLYCVESVKPAVNRAGIVKQGDLVHGVLFRGTEVNDFPDSVAYPLAIPSRLSSMLSVKQGGQLTVYFVGKKTVVRKFQVCSIYDSVLSSDNQLVCQTTLPVMQRINTWDEDQVSAFEIRLKPAYRGEEAAAIAGMDIASTIYAFSDESEPSVLSRTLTQTYPTIFSWFSFLDLNVLVLLVLMTIVAGFNVISGLLILLFENISTIGLLKAMGMTDKGIAAVFLRSAGVLTLKGMAAGNAIALLFCLIQDSTHLLKLDPHNYFLSFVPVHIDWAGILAADAVSLIVILLLMLIPSLFISKVDPASTIRVE
ncbi:MAG: FtsX-like permease family protein [Rikenellaceae bacterium]|nr:FtsX-like permease family protein [Rikenellaceae bacterium]MDY3894627.1 FtsX-like permease family protein [Candidatus Cryptobacteroides sp.]